MTSLKSVWYLIFLALMGSFSDPIFTLGVSLLEIQGPYSHFATARVGIFLGGRAAVYSSQRPHHQAEASSHCWEALGSTTDAWALCPSPVPLTKTLPPSALWDNAPETSWGKGGIL